MTRFTTLAKFPGLPEKTGVLLASAALLAILAFPVASVAADESDEAADHVIAAELAPVLHS